MTPEEAKVFENDPSQTRITLGSQPISRLPSPSD